MASCPRCQTSLPDDFGLLECSNCGASVFVDMDGNVITGSTSNDSNEASAQEMQESLVQDDDKTIMTSNMAAIENVDINEDATMVAQTMEPLDNFGIEQEVQEQAAYVAQETPVENWQVNSTEEAFADVVNFGNQDTVYQHDGPLSYIVTLSGIDSTDLENQIKEVLTDKRLILDVDQLWPTLKNGELKLIGLSPVKTYVLISKIYHLPIEVKWEQHVLSE